MMDEPNLVAVDLWYSDGTSDTLTQIQSSIALDRVKKIKEQRDAFNRPVCSRCEFYDFNEMSDESYCIAKDYEQIRLYRKHRPDWCPRLNK